MWAWTAKRFLFVPFLFLFAIFTTLKADASLKWLTIISIYQTDIEHVIRFSRSSIYRYSTDVT